jgi:ABC-type nickel/cobalt efflux system permease component RcnA
MSKEMKKPTGKDKETNTQTHTKKHRWVSTLEKTLLLVKVDIIHQKVGRKQRQEENSTEKEKKKKRHEAKHTQTRACTHTHTQKEDVYLSTYMYTHI